jgi:hypothetical protein
MTMVLTDQHVLNAIRAATNEVRALRGLLRRDVVEDTGEMAAVDSVDADAIIEREREAARSGEHSMNLPPQRIAR